MEGKEISTDYDDNGGDDDDIDIKMMMTRANMMMPLKKMMMTLKNMVMTMKAPPVQNVFLLNFYWTQVYLGSNLWVWISVRPSVTDVLLSLLI